MSAPQPDLASSVLPKEVSKKKRKKHRKPTAPEAVHSGQALEEPTKSTRKKPKPTPNPIGFTEEAPNVREHGELHELPGANTNTSPSKVMTGYFLIDGGRPDVYTLYGDDDEEITIDEGEDLSATVQRFLECGWVPHSAPWTYACATDGSDEIYHCQVVVSYA